MKVDILCRDEYFAYMQCRSIEVGFQLVCLRQGAFQVCYFLLNLVRFFGMDIAEFTTAVFGMILQAAQQDTRNTFLYGSLFASCVLSGFPFFHFTGGLAGEAQGLFFFFQLLLQGIAVHFLLFFVEVVIAAVASQSVAGEFANGG